MGINLWRGTIYDILPLGGFCTRLSLPISLSLKIPRGMRNAHLSKLWTVLNISSCTTVVKPPPTLLQKQKRKKKFPPQFNRICEEKKSLFLSFGGSVTILVSWISVKMLSSVILWLQKAPLTTVTDYPYRSPQHLAPFPS